MITVIEESNAMLITSAASNGGSEESFVKVIGLDGSYLKESIDIFN